jgi:ribokinase
MVIQTEHLPVPGETILGGKFFMNPGGKGANQAVAAARLGGKVTFISKTGNDLFGQKSVENFEKEGINTEFMVTDQENPSGVALITVDSSAENCIVVAPGANSSLNREDIVNAREVIETAQILLMQLEIPIDTVLFAAQMAFQKGVKTILNPAPACLLPDELYGYLHMITPNETETELLTGIKVADLVTAKKAAEIFHRKGIKIVVITMGSKGAFVSDGTISEIISAPKVEAIDTTASGDVFNGALAVAISEEFEIRKAVEFACKAASIAVTRLGAQSSAPYLKELK